MHSPSYPRLIAAFYLALILGLSGCASMGTSGDTMAVLDYPLVAGQRQDTLLVMLPGINNSPSAFAAAGMVSGSQSQWRVDVLAVDASLKYYMDRSIVRRLHDEVVAPARSRGYRQVWLIGSSMGGFGCLLYAQLHPQDIAGIVMLAPFLGEGSLQKELQAAGGLAKWHYQPGSGSDEQDKKVREIWYWLQENYLQEAVDGRPKIWLAWGDKDKFRPDAAALAAVMPAGQTLTMAGGHDWKTWAGLLGQLLPSLGLPAQAPGP